MPVAHTLTATRRFPQGTTVAVYARSDWSPVYAPSGAPPGSQVTSGVMGASSVTFTGLTEGVAYVAYALVDGEHRYVHFTAHGPSSSTYPVLERSDKMPVGGIRENMPRPQSISSSTVTASASGDLRCVGVECVAGDPIANISFFAGGTALGTGTHLWMCLLDANRNVLAVTADDTAPVWAAVSASADGEKKMALTTPYVVTASGVIYAGVCVVATTMPTFSGVPNPGGLALKAPVLSAKSSTGLTTPPTVGTQMAAFTGVTGTPYVLLS